MIIVIFSCWVGSQRVSEVTQSCLTLCNPMDCSPPGFSIHGIFQARVLEWVAISSSTREFHCLLIQVILMSLWNFFYNQIPDAVLCQINICVAPSYLCLKSAVKSYPAYHRSHIPLLKWLSKFFSSVQLLSCVWLFVTLWTAACQASLSITNLQSLLKLISIDSVMPSNHPIICLPLLILH